MSNVLSFAPRGGDAPARAQDDVARVWRKRIDEARRDRGRYEPVWHENLAFAAGRHHLKWDRFQRTLYLPQLPKGRERYSADVITEYRNTMLGELVADDDRPELQFRSEDIESQEFAQQANMALAYGWESEWQGDDVLLAMKRMLIDLGTCAVRCRFDPTLGPVKANVPHDQNEVPILDPQAAREYVAGLQAQGQFADIRDIHEGRVTWELLSPFMLLVPPGIEHERDFPWEVVVTPVLVDKLQEQYGNAAAGLRPEPNIGTVPGRGSALSEGDSDPEADPGAAGKLADHTWVYTCYERPTRSHPKGQTVVLAGSEMKPLAVEESLPYQGPDETPRSGISYFHFWRVTSRFWGRALIEPMKDPQRLIDKRRSQSIEIIDRALPKVYVRGNAPLKKPRGLLLEVVRLPDSAQSPPLLDPGAGPGAWMQADVEAAREDLEHAAGIKGVTLGENPVGVQTLGQLQLLRENDQIKSRPLLADIRAGVKELVENSVYDIRRYWGAAKQIALAGDEGMVQASLFNACKLPSFFKVQVAKGSAKINSQAGEMLRIREIADYAAAIGQPPPAKWLADSYAAGEMLPLPEPPSDEHREKAEIENHRLIEGEPVHAAPYDDQAVHIEVVTSLVLKAEITGDQRLYTGAMAHRDEHLALQQQAEQAALAAQAAQTMPPQPQRPSAPPPPPAA